MAFPFLELIAREALFEVFNQGSLINTVTRNFENTIASQGESVTVIMPETPTMVDVSSQETTFAADAANPSTVTLTLDKSRQTKPISVDIKTASLADRNVLAMYAAPIAEAIRLDLESAILTELKTLTATINDPAAGTVVPTGIDGLFFPIKSKLDALKAPLDNRYAVVGASLEAEYWKTFGTAQNSGDTGVQEQIRGFMGQKLGVNFISNSSVESSALLGVTYNQNAVALATRPMKVSDLAPNTMATVGYNGISLTIEQWHDPRDSKDYIKGMILYGLKVLTSKGAKIGKKSA